jgi:hypothetical protein
VKSDLQRGIDGTLIVEGLLGFPQKISGFLKHWQKYRRKEKSIQRPEAGTYN